MKLSSSDDELVDFKLVQKYAKAGLKDPKMIALKMGVPFSVFEMCMDDIEMSIKLGHADLAIESIAQIRGNAEQGDFQAQKYILQNVDETYSDRRETTTNHNHTLDMPALGELFAKGIKQLEDHQAKGKLIEGESRIVDAKS